MRGSAAVAHTSRGIPNEWPAEAPYDDTDSEHEQPFWRLGSDRSRRQDEEESTDSSSSSSDGGTDDETNAERRRRFRCGSGSHARRSKRRVARGGRDIDVVQSDWNDAMTSSAVPTGADDDRGITYDTKATRGGAALEKGNERDVRLSVATTVGRTRGQGPGGRASGADGADTEDADGGGMCGSAETQRGPASCHGASYPGDESLRRSYPGDEDVGILKKSQGGNENFSVAEEVGHARSKVSGHRASGAEKCDTQERRLSLSANDRNGWWIEFGYETNRRQVRRCVISLKTILEHYGRFSDFSTRILVGFC